MIIIIMIQELSVNTKTMKTLQFEERSLNNYSYLVIVLL